MARETRAQREEREIREQTASATAQAEFLKTLPRRIKTAEEFARRVGLRVEIALEATGPVVTFGHYLNEFSINYQAEEWEMDYVDQQLILIKDEIEKDKRLLDDVRSLLAGISQELRGALRTHKDLI